MREKSVGETVILNDIPQKIIEKKESENGLVIVTTWKGK
jgi:hypothetical protein